MFGRCVVALRPAKTRPQLVLASRRFVERNAAALTADAITASRAGSSAGSHRSWVSTSSSVCASDAKDDSKASTGVPEEASGVTTEAGDAAPGKREAPPTVDGDAVKKQPGKLRTFVKDYGPLGLVSWTGFWLAGIPVLYVGFRATDNFGFDAMGLLEHLGARESTASLLGLDPKEPISAKTTSLMLAIAVNEVVEPVRWLVLIPFVRWARRALDRRAAAAPRSSADRDDEKTGASK
mmetsp:Transcript_4257/g.15694  ORF Transcript_4257/g.15694 Transcript_4257/m.15694 type:complete len:237 (-) Transcript_4257:1012-1722(-)